MATIFSAFEPLKIRAPTHAMPMTSSTLSLPLHAVKTFEHRCLMEIGLFTAAQDQNHRVRSTHLNGVQTS